MDVSSISGGQALDVGMVNKAMVDAVDKTIQQDNRLLRAAAGVQPQESADGQVGQAVNLLA